MDERAGSAPEVERAPEQVDIPSNVPQGEGYSADRHELTSAYSRRSRRAVDAPVEASDFRVRDFRPTNTSAPAQSGNPVQPGNPAQSDDSGQLTYRTEARPAAVGPAQPQPVVDAVPAQFAAPPRPMTRRELRELEIRQGTRPQANDGPVLEVPPAPATPPAPAPAPVVEPAPAPAAAAPPVVPLAPPIPLRPEPAAEAPEAPAAPSAPVPPVVSPEPVVFTDASGAPSPSRPSVAPTPVNRGIDYAPQVFSSPDAHWQTQTQIDVVNLGDSDFPRAGGGSGAVTTNALVIPTIPQASDITRPFSSTGEILVTGSIDLPMALGSTGAIPARYDHADIDALFAQEDHDYAPTDAAPVRAIRAVSTHTSTHGVISAKKPANNRLPMMMAVTAGILAVGVAALFAAGMIFGYF